jgi:hypothetical protein
MLLGTVIAVPGLSFIVGERLFRSHQSGHTLRAVCAHRLTTALYSDVPGGLLGGVK